MQSRPLIMIGVFERFLKAVLLISTKELEKGTKFVRILFLLLLNLQDSGVSGQRGVRAQRPVVLVEGVTEHARVREEPRAWAPRGKLKSVKCRTVQVRERV